MAADFGDWQLVGCYVLARKLQISGSGSPWNFRIDVLPYDHKNLLDGTPALLYYYLYAHVTEAEKKLLGM